MADAIGPAWLSDRIARGETVIIDGATGSELEARGVPMVEKGWSVLAQLEYPEILRQLHQNYVDAGASVIITNTFGSGRHLLEPGGRNETVGDAHRLAAEIAIDVRDNSGHEVAVAGSVSCYMADAKDPRWLARLRETYEEQVTLLVEAGVDIINLEMMQSVALAGPAVAAASESGLPVWLGLTATRRPDGQLGSFDPPHEELGCVIEELMNDSVGVVNIMHSAVGDTGPALELVRRCWTGPLGAYPESGYYEEPSWNFVDVIDPLELVQYAQAWRADHGVQIFGGCCGLGVDHIEALSREMTS